MVVGQGATPLSVRQYMARLDPEHKCQNPNNYIYFHLFSDMVCNVGWKLKTPLACFRWESTQKPLKAVSELPRAIKGILVFWGR